LTWSGFGLEFRYGVFCGHRGCKHSLLFASILAALALAAGLPHALSGLNRACLWQYFFVAAASHGFLDAMTNGGFGLTLFSPFDNTRFFLPWHPILVSPISLTRFFNGRARRRLRSELIWIWIPTGLPAVLTLVLRRVFLRVHPNQKM
jgi:inner membrane protein